MQICYERDGFVRRDTASTAGTRYRCDTFETASGDQGDETGFTTKVKEDQMNLRQQIEGLTANAEFSADDRSVFEEFKAALRRGEIRSAEKDADGNWHANALLDSSLRSE